MSVERPVSGQASGEDTFPVSDAEIAVRAKALESLLIEKGLVSNDAIDKVVSAYETDIGPMLGAKVVARAWTDPEFKKLLLEDANAACEQLGIGGMQGEHMVVVENTNGVHNTVVCTLCSCYPWPVLGLPPNWYKYPQYRSRAVMEPRKVLREEFGLDLDESKDVRVWDSSAEIRYFVLPERPEGTEGMSEEELAALVTRDSMIGVGAPRDPQETR
ncbi:MAG: Nitrile hydratase, alpha chain [uncultured Rubrobacteraceae bacterium]|uniref:nitrile hydratase n=1 Tax=uncultured Rubrobacteraceae bacterium TaxID=349277 RepID=A0A6J4RC14_9ACTN|nr:MAG: Nitrile hydratase, alpha chain [uncultured Rubrobacteraceae bacterium]